MRQKRIGLKSGTTLRLSPFHKKSLEKIAELNHQTSSALIRLGIERLIYECNKSGGRLPFVPVTAAVTHAGDGEFPFAGKEAQ